MIYSYKEIGRDFDCLRCQVAALDFFKPEEVPEDIRSYWFMAQQHKNTMKQFLSLIEEKIDNAEAE